METKKTLFNRLKKLIQENPDGFTANSNGEKLNLNSGYAVSITQNTGKINAIINKILEMPKPLEPFNYGGWENTEKKTYALDITLIKEKKEDALKIASENNQIAIFDFANMQEIRL